MVTETELVITLKEKYVKYWRNEPDSYWFARLVQEIGELGSSLVGDHKDPPEWELRQISAICLNWLEKLADDKADKRPHVIEANPFAGVDFDH